MVIYLPKYIVITIRQNDQTHFITRGSLEIWPRENRSYLEELITLFARPKCMIDQLGTSRRYSAEQNDCASRYQIYHASEKGLHTLIKNKNI